MSTNFLIDSLLSGCISSTFTTVMYQPLELLKTKIQLKHDLNSHYMSPQRILGRTTQTASNIIRNNGLMYLWKGTGPSLIRSVPGVGMYYASLSILQTNFSGQQYKPDNPRQAFYFAIFSRSMISFILLPVTVIKTRYESGQYRYQSLLRAIADAYRGTGWVAVTPTILRDSLFSGIYYMCYTKLKAYKEESIQGKQAEKTVKTYSRSTNFSAGVLSGIIASIITNPIDVIKTRLQVEQSSKMLSSVNIFSGLLKERYGLLQFFDGLVPRSIRRTLIVASTWTFYEFLMDELKRKNTKDV